MIYMTTRLLIGALFLIGAHVSHAQSTNQGAQSSGNSALSSTRQQSQKNSGGIQGLKTNRKKDGSRTSSHLSTWSRIRRITVSVPVLSLSKESLEFTLNGGDGTASDTFGLTCSSLPGSLGRNRTQASVLWTATSSQSWLAVAPASGSIATGTSQVLTATVSAAGLDFGLHEATITLQGGRTTLTLPVALNVVGPGELTVTPASLSFESTAGGAAPSSQSITIENTGGAPVDWMITLTNMWINPSQSSGSLDPGSSVTVTISPDTSNLEAGAYAESLIVNGSETSHLPRIVGISLQLNEPVPAQMNDLPATLAFNMVVGQENPSPETFQVSNSGGSPME